MYRDIDQVLFDARRIADRVDALAGEITADLRAVGLAGDDAAVTLVPVMTGSLVFVADLIRRLPWRLRLRMVSVSSYPGAATRSGGVSLGAGFGELPADLRGRHVLVVDDILDSGRTLAAVTAELKRREPASLRTCVLLKKLGRQEVDARADYVGFEVPDRFVVGYGLDHDGLYRNLPEIATLRAGRSQPEDQP